MENSLNKIAEQLDGFDEASLTGLWEKYHDIVTNFEPTKRWEQAALVLSLIQAVRWKNQLFNSKWAEQSVPESEGNEDSQEFKRTERESEDYTNTNKSGEKGKVISFFSKKENDK